MHENKYYSELLEEQFRFLENTKSFVDFIDTYSIEDIYESIDIGQEKLFTDYDSVDKGDFEVRKTSESLMFTFKDNDRNIIAECFFLLYDGIQLKINKKENSPIFFKNEFHILNEPCQKSSRIKKILKERFQHVFLSKTIVDEFKTNYTFLARKELIEFNIIERNDKYTIIFDDINGVKTELHTTSVEKLADFFEYDLIDLYSLKYDY